MTRSRIAAVALALVLMLAGACTSSTDDAGSDDTSTVGVTDDTVTVSMVVADLSALTEQNLAPDLGDPVATAEAVVAEINADGGAGGRQIELSTHVIPGLENFTPEAGRAECLQATQEDQSFVVVVTPAVVADVVRCLSVTNETVTMTMDSWDAQLYSDAESRLFSGATNTSVGLERSYAAWPGILRDVDALTGDETIGIIRTELPAQGLAVDDGLKPALADLDYEVAAEAVIPCPEGTTECAQHDVAIQRMKDAGVDFVFLAVQTLAGAATVQAAVDLGFDPQWATIGQNVTDTVAQFYAPTRDAWDGAWGVDTVFPEPSAEAQECNRIVSDRTGVDYEPGSDAYGFAAVVCLELQIVADAIAAVDGPLTRQSLIESLEAVSEVPSAHGPAGSFAADKHDAGDHLFLSRYDAATGEFVALDATPREVD